MAQTLNSRVNTGPFVGLSLLALLLALPLAAKALLPETPLTLGLVNGAVALIVFVQGLGVIRVIWDLEKQFQGLFPLASCYFTVQHAAFGFGGVLVSLSDRGYMYMNDHGTFSYAEFMLPLMLAHFLAMNAGLAGVWVATRRARRQGRMGALEFQRLRQRNWSWDELRPVCIVSLALHGIFTLVFLMPELSMPFVVRYPAQAMEPIVAVTFVFWGLAWQTCTRKSLFAAYYACYLTLEVIRGQRGNFLIVSVLFALGYLLAGNRFSIRPMLKWAPLIALLLVCIVKAENVRSEFTRGTPDSVDDAMARLGSLADSSDDFGYSFLDAQGILMNGTFRIAARLFELSAMDVVARTPSEVPYRGWDDSDWTDLISELLPVKLYTDAAVLKDDHAGVLFLHDYGWSAVDPSQGNAMPATLVADSFRRYSWAGVVVWFVFWGWALASASGTMRSSGDRFVMIFAATMLLIVDFLYSSDIVSLAATLPRRLMLAALYAITVRGLAAVISRRGQSPDTGAIPMREQVARLGPPAHARRF